MNIEQPFQLKQTNVSRPQLSHSGSQQSIAASEGYYSVSGNTSSSESDDHSKPQRFQTPPSHRSPAQSHEHLQHHAETPVTQLKGVGIPRQHPQYDTRDHIRQSPTVSTIAERPETQGTITYDESKMESNSLATTPGMDTTPYIRFAIDQLTRDEEVRGSRMYPRPAAEEDYPVERIIPDDGLGYMAQEQETQRRISRPPPPPKPPAPVPMQNTGLSQRAVQRDIFVPFYPPADSHQYALRFIPSILRPLWLGLYIFLCLCVLAALIFSAVYSNRTSGSGLWNYISFGDGRYFVFEYLPTMVGMIMLMWLFQVQIALQRIVPFIALASENNHQRSEAMFLQIHPMQFLVPQLDYFRAGQPLIGACYVIFWLFLWTIPLLASSFNVRYSTDESAWRWIAVQGVIWTAIVLYILLILALIALLVFLVRSRTGLRWDPRSLADIISLLERSNVITDYSNSETFTKSEFRHKLGGRTDRLGYWHTTRRPNDVFYGIGEEGGATRRYSIENGRIREKGPEQGIPEPERPGDFSIRMDIRSSAVRLRHLPFYLRDTSVIAWIVTAIILLIAFYVISFINSAVRLGFLPQVFARTNSAGFSASNFLYSFVPAVIGTFLVLVLFTFDYSIRSLQPFMSLSRKGGATAEQSLLVDYSSRLPLSVTLAALENRHFQPAILSFGSLCATTLPVLAGGCFWTQYYENSNLVRVAADLPGYYALCFFLALYTFTLLALIPGRRRAALPHASGSLAEIISWVYQSQILSDRAFARPQTKPELVARLMGTAYAERGWHHSVTNLVRSSRDDLREESQGKAKGKEKAPVDEDASKRLSVVDPGSIRYGFGIHVGRDGLEHLGIDRVQRGGERSGRELVIWEEQKRRSWAGSV